MIDDCKYFAALLSKSSTKGERVKDGAEEKWRDSLSNAAHKRCNQIKANPPGVYHKSFQILISSSLAL